MARHQKQTDRSNIDEECLNRLNKIHTLIKEATLKNTVVSLQAIQEYLPPNAKTKGPISRATIYRDLALLSANKEDVEHGGFGAPIKFDRVQGGYYYTDPTYDFISDSSAPENLVSLVIAKDLLSNLSNESPIYKKISDITKEITGAEYSKLTERIAIAPRPQKKIDASLWQAISTALTENRILKLNVKYFGMTKPYTLEYNFSPYQLIFDEGNYYLWGLENLDEGFKTESPKILLSLNDIDSGELTDKTFELPEDFCYKKEPTEYKIKLYTIARNDIVNCAFAEEQKILEKNEEEGSITISFKASEFLLVHKWVMEHGANVIPLEPKELVDAWKNEIYCSIQKSEIDSDWILLHQKKSKEIILNKNNTIRKWEDKYKDSNNDELQNIICSYLANLINIRANIPLEYLKIMSARNFAEYMKDYIIPSVSESEIKYLIKKTGFLKDLKAASITSNKEFSKSLIDLKNKHDEEPDE